MSALGAGGARRADAAVLVTDWPEFAEIDWAEAARRMRTPAAGRRPQLPRPRGAARGGLHLRGDRTALGERLMQALILAGGEGTRLRPLTETVPKTVLPLAGRPFTAYTIDWLERHGVDEVVVSCGYLAEGMQAALGRSDRAGADLRRRARAARHRGRDQVLRGDARGPLPGPQRRRAHRPRPDRADRPAREHRARGRRSRSTRSRTPAATAWSGAADDGEITEFLEKPEPDQIDTDEINAGAYVLERSVLELIPPDRAVSIERETFQELIGNGLYGRRLEGYWIDIGTPERFRQASWDILERRVETVVGEMIDADGTLIVDGAEVDPGATVKAAGAGLLRRPGRGGRDGRPPCGSRPRLRGRVGRGDRGLGPVRRLRRRRRTPASRTRSSPRAPRSPPGVEAAAGVVAGEGEVIQEGAAA